MKRLPRPRLRTLLVFLLLGAAVNVAVAWAFATLGKRAYAYGGRVYLPVEDAERERMIHLGWQPLPIQGRTRSVTLKSFDEVQFGVTFREIWETEDWSSETDDSGGISSLGVMDETIAGWPLLSMSGLWFDASSPSSRINGHNVMAYDAVFKVLPNGRLLPMRPRWPGFAINTIFYAGVLWLLFAARGSVRRRLRIKRNLCPACAYPVGTNPICTECGKPVAPSSVEPI